MGDKIRISGLPIECRVGVSEEERSRPQTLLIEAELLVDLRPSGLSDDIGLTVNYTSACEVIRDCLQRKPRRLIETVAEDAAAALLEAFPIERIAIEVRKPAALRSFGAEFAAVRIERGRDD